MTHGSGRKLPHEPDVPPRDEDVPETGLRGLWKDGAGLAELEAEHRAEIERDEARIDPRSA
jgi:hypothetical protein